MMTVAYVYTVLNASLIVSAAELAVDDIAFPVEFSMLDALSAN